jgi:uncharacterized protein (DUF488 family)
MFSRQRTILRLIQNDGGRISRLRLVKLAFLVSRGICVPRGTVYDFIPYKRGPFSFTLYHELRALERDGWIAQDDHDVLTGRVPALEVAFLDPQLLRQIDDISARNRSINTSALVDAVYQDYPWFTLNSETVHKRKATRPIVENAVYTVGYEGLMVDALLDLLLRAGIRRLIDVRCNPIARRYGFHKSTLQKLCNDLGVDYIHFKSLGVPSTWRTSLGTEESYEHLFQRYEREVLPKQTDSVERVACLVTEMPSALMCMEADHHCCHRSRLAAEIVRRTSLPLRELRET